MCPIDPSTKMCLDFQSLLELLGFVDEGEKAQGGHSLFNYCIHVHLGPIYRGYIYLAEKIKRYGIF